jgi:hypothetical protein
MARATQAQAEHWGSHGFSQEIEDLSRHHKAIDLDSPAEVRNVRYQSGHSAIVASSATRNGF